GPGSAGNRGTGVGDAGDITRRPEALALGEEEVKEVGTPMRAVLDLLQKWQAVVERVRATEVPLSAQVVGGDGSSEEVFRREHRRRQRKALEIVDMSSSSEDEQPLGRTASTGAGAGAGARRRGFRGWEGRRFSQQQQQQGQQREPQGLVRWGSDPMPQTPYDKPLVLSSLGTAPDKVVAVVHDNLLPLGSGGGTGTRSAAATIPG
ncbi:unnamed protein product, partial [Discosporangium mesarthrocarpum]